MTTFGKLLIQPNLFLIGGMRCGSTTLHLMLGQHPDIYMSPVKEPYFYVAEAMRRNMRAQRENPEAKRRLDEYVKRGKHRELHTYAALFEAVSEEKYVGESSHYLYHPEIASVIFEDCPHASKALAEADLAKSVSRAIAILRLRITYD